MLIADNTVIILQTEEAVYLLSTKCLLLLDIILSSPNA